MLEIQFGRRLFILFQTEQCSVTRFGDINCVVHLFTHPIRSTWFSTLERSTFEHPLRRMDNIRAKQKHAVNIALHVGAHIAGDPNREVDIRLRLTTPQKR